MRILSLPAHATSSHTRSAALAVLLDACRTGSHSSSLGGESRPFNFPSGNHSGDKFCHGSREGGGVAQVPKLERGLSEGPFSHLLSQQQAGLGQEVLPGTVMGSAVLGIQEAQCLELDGREVFQVGGVG